MKHENILGCHSEGSHKPMTPHKPSRRCMSTRIHLTHMQVMMVNGLFWWHKLGQMPNLIRTSFIKVLCLPIMRAVLMNVGYENERGGRVTESTGFYLVVTLRWRRLWTNMILCEYGSARSKVSFSKKGILEIKWHCETFLPVMDDQIDSWRYLFFISQWRCAPACSKQYTLHTTRLGESLV